MYMHIHTPTRKKSCPLWHLLFSGNTEILLLPPGLTFSASRQVCTQSDAQGEDACFWLGSSRTIRKCLTEITAPSYLQESTHTASSQPFSLLTFAMPSLLEERSTRSSLHAVEQGPEAGNWRFGFSLLLISYITLGKSFNGPVAHFAHLERSYSKNICTAL